MPTVTDRLGYAALRAVETWASARSWEQRVALGRRLGRLWHAVDGGHRRVAAENVAAAFPDWSRKQVADLVRTNFEHLGVTAVEFLGLSGESIEDVLRRWDFEGLEHLEEALGQGKGVFLLTGHLGNWEVAGFALAAMGYPCRPVARRIKNPLVDEWIVAARQRAGGRVIPHRNAVRPVLKALHRNEVVGMLLDQRALYREGVRSEFFGRPVSTNQGLALLALKTGAPVVPVFDRRMNGGHVTRFRPPLELSCIGSREEQVAALTRTFDAEIEAAVRECPEQWFWLHRRWRVPRELRT